MSDAPYISQPRPPYGDRVVWHVPSGARLPKGWREVKRLPWWDGASHVFAERVRVDDGRV